MRGIRLLGLLSRRRPAGQKIQPIFGGGAGFSGIHHKCQAWIGWQVHRLESQMKIPDDRVVDVLESGAVKAHIVGGPASTELFAEGGEFTNQITLGRTCSCTGRRRVRTVGFAARARSNR